MRRICVVAGLCCAVWLAAVAPAGAAMTFGSDLGPGKTPSSFACTGSPPCNDFNTVLAAGNVAAPIDGVITSWRVLSGAATAGVQLRVLHPLGGGQYTFAGTGASQDLTASPGIPQTFGDRLTVRADDLIGLDHPGTASIIAGSVTGSHQDEFSPTQADGFTGAPGFSFNNFEVLLQATVEPDADRDGYGDDTQDDCPGDPTLHSHCAEDLSITKSASGATGLVGGQTSYTLTVRNNGAGPALETVLTDPLPASVTLVSATPTAGTCGAGQTLSCSLGTMAGGATIAVTVVVKPTSAGPVPNVATVSARTDDPNRANNSASATFTAVAPKVTLGAKRLKLGRRLRAPLSLSCQGGGADCVQRLKLTVRRKTVLTRTVRIRAGSKLRVQLSVPRKLFGRKKTLRATLLVVSEDRSTSTRGTLTLKRP
jgi:uncharacterized repeat protein (TIGR01451 family)